MKTEKRRYTLTHFARKQGSKINTKEKTIYVKYGDFIPPHQSTKIHLLGNLDMLDN